MALLHPSTRRKYGNKKVPGARGRLYDSIKEAAYSHQLEARLQAGDIAGWEPQVRITLLGAAGQPLLLTKKHAVAVVDFVVTRLDGTIEFHDTKGYHNPRDLVTRHWLLQKALVQQMYPERPWVQV